MSCVGLRGIQFLHFPLPQLLKRGITKNQEMRGAVCERGASTWQRIYKVSNAVKRGGTSLGFLSTYLLVVPVREGQELL